MNWCQNHSLLHDTTLNPFEVRISVLNPAYLFSSRQCSKPLIIAISDFLINIVIWSAAAFAGFFFLSIADSASPESRFAAFLSKITSSKGSAYSCSFNSRLTFSIESAFSSSYPLGMHNAITDPEEAFHDRAQPWLPISYRRNSLLIWSEILLTSADWIDQQGIIITPVDQHEVLIHQFFLIYQRRDSFCFATISNPAGIRATAQFEMLSYERSISDQFQRGNETNFWRWTDRLSMNEIIRFFLLPPEKMKSVCDQSGNPAHCVRQGKKHFTFPGNFWRNQLWYNQREDQFQNCNRNSEFRMNAVERLLNRWKQLLHWNCDCKKICEKRSFLPINERIECFCTLSWKSLWYLYRRTAVLWSDCPSFW